MRVGVFLLLVIIYIAVGDPIIKSGRLRLHLQVKSPHIVYACLKQEPEFPSTYGVFYIHLYKIRGDCPFLLTITV